MEIFYGFFQGSLRLVFVDKNILIEGSKRLKVLRYSYMIRRRNVAWFLVVTVLAVSCKGNSEVLFPFVL